MFWIENQEAESNTEKKTEEDDDAFKEKEDKLKKISQGHKQYFFSNLLNSLRD